MELVHLLHFLLALDERWLRPLTTWVPDCQRVLSAPAEVLRESDIEIGPWTRYVRGYVMPILLVIPAMIAIAVAGSLPVTICVTLVWLLVAAVLSSAGRGGSCILQARGVDFRYRGLSVFCPWELFDTPGRAVYYPEQYRLDLPVNPDALARIEVRKNDSLVAEDAKLRTPHVRVAPGGEIRLNIVYGVQPAELGDFLLSLGRALGGSDGMQVKRPPAARSPVQRDERGWIHVPLTRLRFPPYCCDCGQVADSQQEFRGYRSMFSADFSTSLNESVLVLAPVCRVCQASNRGRYWRTLLVTIPLAIIGVTLAGFLLGVILDLCGLTPGPGAMVVIMTCSGLVVSVGASWFIADKYARAVSAPLTLSDYRPADGTIRIRFRNPQYAEVLLAAM